MLSNASNVLAPAALAALISACGIAAPPPAAEPASDPSLESAENAQRNRDPAQAEADTAVSIDAGNGNDAGQPADAAAKLETSAAAETGPDAATAQVGGDDATASSGQADVAAATPDAAPQPDTAVEPAPDAAAAELAPADAQGADAGATNPQAGCATDADCAGKAVISCMKAVCQVATGQCGYAADLNAGACDDGNACTTNDTCKAGQCGGDGISCEDSDACTADACVPAVGCVHTPAAGGTQCPGGACDGSGKCVQGVGGCANGSVNCDDKQPCTIDTCGGDGQCYHMATNDNDACDDGNPCTPAIYDKCKNGKCQNIKNICGCATDADCLVFDDGNLCNGGYACVDTPIGKQCQAKIAAVSCQADSAAPCLAQACNPNTGTCAPKPAAGNLCDDGNPCTLDQCGSLGCVHSSYADGVPCDDGNSCTLNQACMGGQCGGGITSNCDDDNPCSKDSCSATGCVHAPIAGCAVCLTESFNPTSLAGNFAMWSEDDEYVLWSVKPEANGNLRAVATWKGPYDDAAGNVATVIVLRNLHLDPQQSASLDFAYRMQVGQQSCGADDLEVSVNGKKAAKFCASTPGDGWQKAVIDLTPWLGQPVEIVIKAQAGEQAISAGTIEIDQLRISGACSQACIANDFENHGAVKSDPSSTLPQAWHFTATDPLALQWERTLANGHSGIAAMLASFAPSGKPQTATWTMPHVRPAAGSKLWFAARSLGASNSECGEDDLILRVGSKVVFQLCAKQPQWQVHSIDMSPWAGQDVDLQFEVSAGPTSAGAFEVDDVALTGACDYACMREDFEGNAVADQWEFIGLGNVPLWSVAAQEGNHFATVAFDAAAPSSQQSHAKLFPEWRWVVPVAGATLALSYKIEGGTGGCSDGGFWSRLMYAKKNLYGQTMDTKDNFANIGLLDVATSCAPTNGWQTVSAEVAASVKARKIVPMFTASPVGAAVQMSFDNFELRCK